MLSDILITDLTFNDNFARVSHISEFENQQQVNKAFSEKWRDWQDLSQDDTVFSDFQKTWYLKLYGFDSEAQLSNFLKEKRFIFDAGCGLGYKSAWLAQLAPHAIVIAMDYSSVAQQAAEQHKHIENLFFVQGDISKPFFKESSVDYINCDQVIMHTESPEETFAQLSRALKPGGEFACYVYAKKALPRELIDEYWRSHCKTLTHDELKELSEQLTDLGKVLSAQNLVIDFPEIPLLGIKGGPQDLQRFIYWNFIKCFWNEELGHDVSVLTNYDWYSPSNAKRYTKEEFKQLIADNDLSIVSFHEEESCYSGRFKK